MADYTRDLGLQAIEMPLIRLAREWWEVGNPSKEGDTLTAKELSQLFIEVGQSFDPEAPYSTQNKDPYTSALVALHKLEWCLVDPHTIKTHTGEKLDMCEGSPACLRTLIRKRYGTVLARLACDRYDVPFECDFLPYRRLLRKMEPIRRRSVLRALSGTFLTQDILHKWVSKFLLHVHIVGLPMSLFIIVSPTVSMSKNSGKESSNKH